MTHHALFNMAVRKRDEERVAFLCDGIVHKALRGLAPPFPLEWDDLRQAARMGIVLALRRYHGAPEHFYLIASAAARNHAIDAIREAAGRRGHKLVQTVTFDFETDEGYQQARQLPSRDMDPCDRVALRQALASLATISPLRARAVIHSLAGGRTADLAAESQTSENNVHQLAQRGRKHLQDRLAA